MDGRIYGVLTVNKRKRTTRRKDVNQSPSAELVARDWLVSPRHFVLRGCQLSNFVRFDNFSAYMN